MKSKATAAYRISFGLLALAAIATQLNRQASYRLSIVNFFSYFTNLSNLIELVVLLVGGVLLLKGTKSSPLFDSVRGAATLYMVIVGIVFSLLLRGEDLGTLLPWVNAVLHYVMPVVALVDWLIVPSKSPASRKQQLTWLAFPLAYLLYSLIRGAALNWYAYPFLNPSKVHGYGGVSLYCFAILGLFLVFGWGIAALGSHRAQRA